MKIWVLTTNDLYEKQTPSEHVVGLFTTKRNVVIEIIKQSEYEACGIKDYDSTETKIYCSLSHKGEVYIVFEATLTKLK